MSTSNFHNANASRIFAFECEDSYDYDDVINNVKNTFEDKNAPYPFFNSHGSCNTELRSYPTRVIGTVEATKEYKRFYVSVSLVSLVRSAYYSGANLDWEMRISVDGDDFDYNQSDAELTESIYEILRERGFNNAKMLTTSVKKWIDKTVNEVKGYVEKVYAENSTPMIAVATFSNGETIYRKAKYDDTRVFGQLAGDL